MKYTVLIVSLVLFSIALGWVCACFLVQKQTFDRMAFVRKRAIPIAVLVICSFAWGWICACFRTQELATERIAWVEDEQASLIATLRKRIYGDNDVHREGMSPDDDARLARFDPVGSVITVSFVGGLGRSDTHVQIQGDGEISITDHGTSRKITTLDRDRCADLFKRVMTSGILNYSDDVIDLKINLTQHNSRSGVLDAPMTEFHISVPALEIEKKFAICAPGAEAKANPDIIEFQLAAALEKEILGFIPKDDPLWK